MSDVEQQTAIPNEWQTENVRLVADVQTRSGMNLTYGFMGAVPLPEGGFRWDDGNRWHYVGVSPYQSGINWMWQEGGNTVTVREPTAEELPRIVHEINE